MSATSTVVAHTSEATSSEN